MNRSMLLLRLLSRRNSTNHLSLIRSKFHSSSNGANPRQSSAFWMGAAGTCVFFQLYDRHHHHNGYTRTEGRPNQEDDDNDNDPSPSGLPWYRRYPTLSGRLRYPTSKKASLHQDPPPSRPPKDNKTLFYGQCLLRQVWQPPVPYPAWDFNWDGKVLDDFSTLEVLSTAQGLQQSSTTGTTRHILLIRHGQYDERPLDDRKRVLTPLGRKQAALTGKRLAAIAANIGADKIRAIYTSDMVRAKQTAYIMAKALPTTLKVETPDPDLNEALPAPIIPPRPDLPGLVEEVDENQERMERVFHKYFYRADPPVALKQALLLRATQSNRQQQLSDEEEEPDFSISTSGTIRVDRQRLQNRTLGLQKLQQKLPPPQHEFNVIVCHGNLIRYFICRALQLPPEAWLRLSVFNCSISYIMIKPNGYVSCRMIGDIGHLGYKETTFSGAHGLVWS